jgi:NAD(P)-dependent dehydrogenase (short-subunit alcohol dehydrogenase family)
LGASSIAAYKPFPLLAPYCASKWAVKGMTQVFAVEMAQHGINVNCYALGIVGTAMWEKLDETLGKMQGRPKGETVRKYVHELTAMGRVSVPEDVSKVVGFLCGPDSEFVTGQNIVVDGGIVFS